jgi:hypothetical protein
MSVHEKTVAEIATQDSDTSRTNTSDVVSSTQSYVLKMDLRLIPILGCTYTILFLDRTNSKSETYAALFEVDI